MLSPQLTCSFSQPTLSLFTIPALYMPVAVCNTPSTQPSIATLIPTKQLASLRPTTRHKSLLGDVLKDRAKYKQVLYQREKKLCSSNRSPE